MESRYSRSKNIPEFSLIWGIPNEYIDAIPGKFNNPFSVMKKITQWLQADPGFETVKIVKRETDTLFKFTHSTQFLYEAIMEWATWLPAQLGKREPYHFNLYWENGKDIKSGDIEVEVNYPFTEFKRKYRDQIGDFKADVTQKWEIILEGDEINDENEDDENEELEDDEDE